MANGIPITPFKDDKDDREFLCLMHFLELLNQEEDMRVLNRQAFKMEQVYQFKLDKYIQYYNYELCEEQSDDEYSEDENSPNGKCDAA